VNDVHLRAGCLKRVARARQLDLFESILYERGNTFTAQLVRHASSFVGGIEAQGRFRAISSGSGS
jgi:hypothetical protein